MRHGEPSLIFNDDSASLIRPLTARNIIPLAVSVTHHTLIENVRSFARDPGTLAWKPRHDEVDGSQNDQSRRGNNYPSYK